MYNFLVRDLDDDAVDLRLTLLSKCLTRALVGIVAHLQGSR